MAAASESHVLHPEDEKHLLAIGLLNTQGGRRVIATSTISSDSSWITVSSEDSAIDTKLHVEIPDHLESVETVNFLGFDSASAAEIWKIWEDFPKDGKFPEGPYEFVDIALIRVKNLLRDVDESMSNKEECLRLCGIGGDLEKVMKDPQHQPLLMTAPISYWLKEAIRMRWSALTELWEESRARLRRIQSQRKANANYEALEEYRPLLQWGGIPGRQETSVKPETIPGSTILWRGGDKGPFDEFLDSGTIDRLQSRWPSDFRGFRGIVLYFAMEQEVAIRYQNWAKHASCTSATALLWIRVPNTLLSRFDQCILRLDASVAGKWKPEDWKQIVWASRRGERFPKSLSHLQSNPIFIGHICKTVNKSINSLEHWGELSHDKYVWNLNKEGEVPHYATQYVFNGDEVVDALEDEASFGIID